MTLFGNQTSAAIQSRIDALRGELSAADQAVIAAEETLEEAIAAGASSDKPLKVLGDARAKASALASVIAKAEQAITAALDREEKERHRKAVAALAVRWERAKAALQGRIAKIVEAVKELEKAEAGYDSLKPEVFEILAACDLSDIGRLIPSAAAFVKPEPMNSPDSNLRSVFTGVDSAIKSAQETSEGGVA
jgi:DNA repair exonuclease SbcCD ATPase subunit